MSKCSKCNHRTDSKYHQVHCLGRRGAQIKRRSATNRGTGGRHAATRVLSFSYAASGPIASASFFEDRKDEAVQS
jgi:hypothetical protein